PDISSDGRWVSYRSTAQNLTTVLVGGFQIYVHDFQNSRNILVSASSAGVPGNFVSYTASISDFGRFVAFESGSTNLMDGVPNSGSQHGIFVRDIVLNQTTTESVNLAGNGTGNADAIGPLI